MKIKKVELTRPFAPVKIELTIESREELDNLIARLDLRFGAVNDALVRKSYVADNSGREFFNSLMDISNTSK